ncbi:MAG TPA: hypothetical protein VGJ41_14320 [Nocardioides sp.]
MARPAHLPAEWPGIEAGALFADLDARLRLDAHTYAHTLITG